MKFFASPPKKTACFTTSTTLQQQYNQSLTRRIKALIELLDQPDVDQAAQMIKQLSALGRFVKKPKPMAYTQEALTGFSASIANQLRQLSIDCQITERQWITYYSFLAAWHGVSFRGNSRQKKLKGANTLLPRATRHDIYLGCIVLFEQLRRSQAIELSAIDPSYFALEVEKMTQIIRAHRTTAQKLLACIGWLFVGLMLLSSIGSTSAIFAALLTGYPAWIVQAVCMTMISASLWVRGRRNRDTGDLFTVLSGHSGLGLDEWVNKKGKREPLPLGRKCALYFTLLLSASMGLSTGIIVYMNFMLAAGTTVAFLAYPPVAIGFAGITFVCVTVQMFKLFLGKFKQPDLIETFLKAPILSVEQYFKLENNPGKHPIRCHLGRYLSYGVIIAFHVVSLILVIFSGYLSAQTVIISLVPLGLSLGLATAISYAITLGLPLLGQLPVAWSFNTAIWGRYISPVIYRVVCGKRPPTVLNDATLESTFPAAPMEKRTTEANLNKTVGCFSWPSFTHYLLTGADYVFGALFCIDQGMRVFSRLRYKMGNRAWSGCFAAIKMLNVATDNASPDSQGNVDQSSIVQPIDVEPLLQRKYRFFAEVCLGPAMRVPAACIFNASI